MSGVKARFFPFSFLFPRLQAGAYQLRQLENIMGAEDQIYVAVALFDLLHHLLFLHHAAAQSDHHVGVLFLSGP